MCKSSKLLLLPMFALFVGCEPVKAPDELMPPPPNNQVPWARDPTPQEKKQREEAAKNMIEKFGSSVPPGAVKPQGESRIRPGGG